MPLARSRYRGGIGSIGQTFSPTATPTCPAGQHYVAPAAGPIRGIGACVPDTVSLRPLTFRAPASQIAPPPAPPILQRPTTPLTFQPAPPVVTLPQVTSAPAPSGGGDAAAAPAPITCPPLWPWWWILVAGAVGFGAGYYAEQNQKKVKRNAGRVASRIVNRAGDVAIARLLG